MNGPDYLTAAEVAKRLRLSLRSIYRLLVSGQIEGLRRGERGAWLILPEAADAYLTSARGPARTASAKGRQDAAMARLEAAGYDVGG